MKNHPLPVATPSAMARPISAQPVLRVVDAAARLGVSVPTVWRYARLNPAFPRPFKLGPNVTVFDADELDAYVASRKVAP